MRKDLMLEIDRLKSLKEFDENLKHRKDMVKNGFYYTELIG